MLPLSISTNIQEFNFRSYDFIWNSFIFKRVEASILYLMGYIMCASKIIDAVNGMLSNFAELMYLDGNLQRIRELKGTKIQTGEAKEPHNFDIGFKNVEFGYGENKVINDISFVAKTR